MSKILYTDLFEYATDGAAQAAWVTDASKLELDYMEYANDGAAQAAYVSSAKVGLDSDTALLMHMDGDNDGTTFADSSTENNKGNAAVTATVVTKTATKKWGTASALFDGDSGYLAYDDHADWDIGTNFTIDFWVKHNRLDTGQEYVDQFVDGSNNWRFIHEPNDNLKFFIQVGGSADPNFSTGNNIIGDTDWHHVALIKVGSDWGIYVDGDQKAYASSSATSAFAGELRIGLTEVADANWLDGYMEELRIQHSNYFDASPNNTPDDTIFVPARAYSTTLNLQCYSEDTTIQQGTYSLKAIATQTGSLNDTLTKSGLSIDLSGVNTLKYYIYSEDRTGSHIKIGIHDSGGTTTEHTANISSTGAWEEQTIDLSGVADGNKDNIDSIIITILNADAENTFYVDNFRVPEGLQCYSEDTEKQQGSYSLKILATMDALNNTLTKTLTDYLDYSIMDVLKFAIRASRTGEHIKLKIHDVGGTTSEHTINIASAGVWQIETWDISGITGTDRDTIDKIIIEIVNAVSANIIYIDNLYSKAIVEHSYPFIG